MWFSELKSQKQINGYYKRRLLADQTNSSSSYLFLFAIILLKLIQEILSLYCLVYFGNVFILNEWNFSFVGHTL